MGKIRSEERDMVVLCRKHWVLSQKTWILVLIWLFLELNDWLWESLILSQPQSPYTSNGNNSSFQLCHGLDARIRSVMGISTSAEGMMTVRLNKCLVYCFKLEQNKSLTQVISLCVSNLDNIEIYQLWDFPITFQNNNHHDSWHLLAL